MYTAYRIPYPSDRSSILSGQALIIALLALFPDQLPGLLRNPGDNAFGRSGRGLPCWTSSHIPEDAKGRVTLPFTIKRPAVVCNGTEILHRKLQ